MDFLCVGGDTLGGGDTCVSAGRDIAPAACARFSKGVLTTYYSTDLYCLNAEEFIRKLFLLLIVHRQIILTAMVLLPTTPTTFRVPTHRIIFPLRVGWRAAWAAVRWRKCVQRP